MRGSSPLALPCLAAALLWAAPAGAGVLERDHPLSEQGTEAFHKGDYDGALRAYEEAARALPGRAELDYNLGDAYMKLGRPDDARRAYQAALGKADDALRARDYYNLGDALAQLDQKQDAIAAFRQALKVDPHFEPARRNLEVLLRKPPDAPPTKGDGGSGDAGRDGGPGPDGGQPRGNPDAGRDAGADAGPDGGAGDRGDAGADGGRDGGRDGGGGADGGKGDAGRGDGGAADAGEAQAPDGGGGADAGRGDGGAADAGASPDLEPADPRKVDRQEAERLLDAMRRNEKQFLMQQHNKKVRPRAHPDRDW